MLNIRELLQVIEPIPETVPEPAAPVEVNFYVHFYERDLRISCICASPDPGEGQLAIKIDYDLGLRFITGQENTVGWVIGTQDGKHVFNKEQVVQSTINRVDCNVLLLLDMQRRNSNADIMVELDEETNQARVYYNGEQIKRAVHPPKLYFTRQEDPSFLKCTLSLSVNILDKILADNNLDEWPNPIILKLDDVSDVSVFFLKNELTASLKT